MLKGMKHAAAGLQGGRRCYYRHRNSSNFTVLHRELHGSELVEDYKDDKNYEVQYRGDDTGIMIDRGTNQIGGGSTYGKMMR